MDALGPLRRFSFSIEAPLAERLQRMVRESRYANRSEFIRDLVRGRMVEQLWERDAEALGTLSLLYDHHRRGLNERLVDIQHHQEARVLATTHVHLDGRLCAEMIMARGRAGEIRHLFDHLRREKGVLHAALSLGSAGERLA
ncbi:MAG TPA: nickel-responsive transcriptional regulator NikR [bacterium]|nr:nickel-responsive transcriptional regulator NikR [bacterium]